MRIGEKFTIEEKAMAKAARKAQPGVQFIQTPAGDDLAVLPRRDYEALLARANNEDVALARIADRALKDLAEGREIGVPAKFAKRIMEGENPIKVVRDWRGLTQKALADAAGLSQNYVSAIENGSRIGRADVLAKIARVLRVPLDLLVE